MHDMEAVLLIIFTVLILILIFFLNNSSKEMDEVDDIITKLQVMGYKASKEYSDGSFTIKVERNNIIISIASVIKDSNRSYRIKAVAQRLNPPVFFLQNRNTNGFHGELPGMSRYYSVETADHNGVIKYLSRQDVTGLIDNLINYYSGILIIGSDGNDLEIKISVEKNTEILLELIREINKLNSVDKHQEDIVIIRDIDNTKIQYKCYNCKEVLRIGADKCPFCDASAPYCVICYTDPEPEDFLSYLTCCQSFAHSKHLSMYIDLKNKCPYCKNKSPIIIDVKN